MPKVSVSTLKTLKQEDRKVRQNLFIDATQKIFRIKTYACASIEEIASEAGIAVSSIFTYFENYLTDATGAPVDNFSRDDGEDELTVCRQSTFKIQHQ